MSGQDCWRMENEVHASLAAQNDDRSPKPAGSTAVPTEALENLLTSLRKLCQDI